MASPIETKLAASVLALQKRGGNVPPQIRACARRVLGGSGSSADNQAIKQYLGIKRSGAGKARQQMRSFDNATNLAVQVGQSVEMISHGGPVAGAGVLNLIKLGTNEIDKIAKSKTVKKVFEGVAGRFFGDAAKGTQAFYSVRRALKIGGGFIEAATIGLDIGSAIEKAWESRHKAEYKHIANSALAYDASMDTLDFARSAEDFKKAAQAVERTESGLGKFSRKTLGFGSDYEDRVKAEAAKALEARKEARRIVGAGGRAAEILSRYASSRNKDVSQLTAAEKADAFDQASKKLADREALGPKEIEYRQQGEEMLVYAKERAAAADGWITPYTYIPTEMLFHEQGVERRRQAARDILAKFRRNKEDPQEIEKRRKLAMERAERALTPVERRSKQQAEDVSQGVYDSFRSRHHMAWSND